MTVHTANIASKIGPLPPDWTIGELLDWIAADDARCHDDELRPVLEAALDSLSVSPGPLAAGTVALVRALAASVREQPRLRSHHVLPPEDQPEAETLVGAAAA